MDHKSELEKIHLECEAQLLAYAREQIKRVFEGKYSEDDMSPVTASTTEPPAPPGSASDPSPTPEPERIARSTRSAALSPEDASGAVYNAVPTTIQTQSLDDNAVQSEEEPASSTAPLALQCPLHLDRQSARSRDETVPTHIRIIDKFLELYHTYACTMTKEQQQSCADVLHTGEWRPCEQAESRNAVSSHRMVRTMLKKNTGGTTYYCFELTIGRLFALVAQYRPIQLLRIFKAYQVKGGLKLAACLPDYKKFHAIESKE
ncbi:hypothetical protein NLG97_g3270 [Lecanicillium saksenae]|uniref:Uncharacterized protein n=1 Tax=Lecanicillium saksenae TaxID=468837 RepID=A0ACC1R1W7_9HYPO|nr:hypothetical protein NLG97_g3270 [Lecanicillium saksenae]